MPAPKGSANAQKGPEAATSFIHARCMPRNKAGWVKAAQLENMKLTEWLVRELNAAARKAGVPD